MIDGNLNVIFRTHIKTAHWQRIETGMTGLGVPDMNYCLDGKEGWIEFKAVTGQRVRLRPEQVGWIERRTRAGGRVFIAARKSDELWIFAGSDARLVAVYPLKELNPLIYQTGGPGSWDWEKIKSLITH